MMAAAAAAGGGGKGAEGSKEGERRKIPQATDCTLYLSLCSHALRGEAQLSAFCCAGGRATCACAGGGAGGRAMSKVADRLARLGALLK